MPKLPRVGARTVKTLISVTVIAVVYSIIGRGACFACIGAVFGMGSSFSGGLQSGGNRFIGTLVGGIIALPFYWLYNHSPIAIPTWIYLPIGVFLLIYICQIFHINGGIQPGAVVFFVVLYTVSENLYITYVIARIIDTGIGVAFSLLINKIFPSPTDKKAKEESCSVMGENT